MVRQRGAYQVELARGEAKPLRVLAEGADAPLALRSGMLAAAPALTALDAAPKILPELAFGAL